MKKTKKDNLLNFQFQLFWKNTEKENEQILNNAVFIYDNLIRAGVSAETAKNSIEKLFNDGYTQGSLEESYNSDEFN